MARPKYTIGSADLAHAWQYLSQRVQLQMFDVSAAEQRQFWEIQSIQADSANTSKQARSVALNNWCDLHLTAADLLKLKSAIRKRRQRMHTSNDQIAITISRRAHEALTKMAKRDKVTLSQLVDRLVRKRFRSGATGAS